MTKIFLLLILTLTSCTHNKVNELNQLNQMNQMNQDNQEFPEKLENTGVVTLFDTPKTINEAVNSPFRTPLFKERDIYRHPIDTLTFFNIKPTMKVLEVALESPWYFEILGPFLNDNGLFIMANQIGSSSAFELNDFNEWSKKYFEISKNIKNSTFNLLDPNFKLGEDSSVDAVLTFRNVHKWMEVGVEDRVFEAFFKVLNSGGILGVVEHRAPKDSTDSSAKTGYVRELDVIRIAKKAGFKYYGKSEVNSNPKDTKDYENGVWSLPPTLVNKRKDREKYTTIGESDRMTLKFIKPFPTL